MELFIWLLFCGGIGAFAHHRNRSAIAWFFVSFFISPLLAAIILAVIKDLSLEKKIDTLARENENIKTEMKFNEKFNDYRAKNIEKKIDYIEQKTDLLLTPKYEAQNKFLSGSNNNGTSKLLEGQSMIRCKKCSKNLPEGAKFCSSCGTSTTLKQSCKNCSNELPADSNFCLSCGTKVFYEYEN